MSFVAPAGGWWLNTVTGHRFPVDNPQRDDFKIVDIAIALGHQARYAGHTRVHYSVALHSVIVARAVEIAGGTPDEIRWGLLHDAAEAYYTDVPWPLIAAGLCPDLRAAEKRAMLAIAERFGLSPEEPQIVRDFDLEALHVESDHLLRRRPDWEISRPASPAMRRAWGEVYDVWQGGKAAMAFIREAKRLDLASDDAVAAARALVSP